MTEVKMKGNLGKSILQTAAQFQNHLLQFGICQQFY